MPPPQGFGRRANLPEATGRPFMSLREPHGGEHEPRSSPTPLRSLAVMPPIVFGAIFLYVAAHQFLFYRKLTHLQQSGVRIEARVTGYHEDSYCRRVCFQNVDFVFIPAGVDARPVQSHAPFLGAYRNQDYKASLVLHTVPIVYDPENPSQSVLDYRDEVFTVDHRRFMISALRDSAEFMIGIPILAILIILFVGGGGRRRFSTPG